MKIILNQRKIVNQCTLLSYFLIILMVFLLIISIADGVFNWNLLPRYLERIGFFFLGACSLIIFASFLIALMINLNIISQGIEDIAQTKFDNSTNSKNSEQY